MVEYHSASMHRRSGHHTQSCRPCLLFFPSRSAILLSCIVLSCIVMSCIVLSCIDVFAKRVTCTSAPASESGSPLAVANSVASLLTYACDRTDLVKGQHKIK